MNCDICSKEFRTKYLVKRHKMQVHKCTETELLKPGRPRGQTFKCDDCNNWHTSSKKELKRHINSQHSTKIRKIEMHCPVDNCSFWSVTRQSLSSHVLSEHSDAVLPGAEITKMSFTSNAEFMSWKLQEESRNKTRYISVRSKCRRGDLTSSTYICHRSGVCVRRGQGIRHMKIQGSCKINKICPATMTVRSDEIGVHVVFSNVHVGHSNNIAHITISKAEREQIASQLAMNVPFETVLKNVRDNLDNENISRLHLLQRHDLSNILRDFKLDTEKYSQNDAESVAIWINKLRNQDEDSIRFVKFQGTPDLENGLNANDFILIIMTDIQKQMLEEFGRNVICIDSTHGTNAYDFSLTTMLVLDEHNEGFPVAFCYSNRTDFDVLKLYFQIIKSATDSEEFTVQTFMTDDCESFYNAWTSVMGAPKNKLLCTWHVERAWRKNISCKIHGDAELKVIIYKHLKLLMDCETITKFQCEVKNFLLACEQDQATKDFGKYFENEYVNRCDQWAYCYRLGLHINTNNHLESFHRVLKQIFMKGLKVNRMDKSISAIMSLIKNKVFDRLLKLNKGKLSRAVQNIRKRHKTSLEMPLQNVQIESSNSWKVKSSNNNRDDYYDVRKESIPLGHSQCPLYCRACNICVHEYSCTCYDYHLHTTICKHIHLVVKAVTPNSSSEETGATSFINTEGSEKNTVGNESLLESIKKTKSTTLAKTQEINTMIDELKGKMLDTRVTNNTQTINYIHHNLAVMLGYINSNTDNKEVSFPLPENAPPNKRSETQPRFFSTKKRRKVTKLNYAKPTGEERRNMEAGLQGSQLCVSTNVSNDHCYLSYSNE